MCTCFLLDASYFKENLTMNEIYKLVLEALENIVKVKGGRGFGPGSVYAPSSRRPDLGKSSIEYEEKEEKRKESIKKPINISRSFKNGIKRNH